MKQATFAKLVARITALDHVVADLHVSEFLQKPNSLEEAGRWSSRLKESARHATIPGFDPAISDALSQEFSEAVDALADLTLSLLRQKLGTQ